jgi:S-(hydroxymethyl)glutathione dehydrogenase/alcohol dehydrogenase
VKTIAAVLVETGKPLVLAELDIPALKPGQVLVEIKFSGVCHTQVMECRGHRGEDRYLPHCLGHEGSGIVCDPGPGVTKVRSGDRVILSWIKGSGADVPGTVYRWDSRNVNSGAITTFSRYSVISENRLTVVSGDLPMRNVALLGCAVPTGVGAVINTAKPNPGQNLAVFGTGGIGLCAVAGAAIAGCSPIIAIDTLQHKLKLASQMGATHVINAAEVNPVEELNRICPGGIDFAIEASGYTSVMMQALLSVRNQGGIVVVVGNAREGERLALDPKQLNMGKQLRGTWGGDNWPDRDFPRYCELLSIGKLNLQPLSSRIYHLSEINQAIDDLETGAAIRPLIDMEAE